MWVANAKKILILAATEPEADILHEVDVMVPLRDVIPDCDALPVVRERNGNATMV